MSTESWARQWRQGRGVILVIIPDFLWQVRIISLTACLLSILLIIPDLMSRCALKNFKGHISVNAVWPRQRQPTLTCSETAPRLPLQHSKFITNRLTMKHDISRLSLCYQMCVHNQRHLTCCWLRFVLIFPIKLASEIMKYIRSMETCFSQETVFLIIGFCYLTSILVSVSPTRGILKLLLSIVTSLDSNSSVRISCKKH